MIPPQRRARSPVLRHRPATLRRVRAVRRLRARGLIYPDIARRLGLSPLTALQMGIGGTYYEGILDPPPSPRGVRGRQPTRPRTAERVALARRLRRRGWSYARIGRRMGVHTRTAYSMAVGRTEYAKFLHPLPCRPTHGLRPATRRKVALVRRLRRAGWSLKVVARRAGVHPQTANEMALGRRFYAKVAFPPPLEPEEKAQGRSRRRAARVRRLFREGESTASIAREVGLPVHTVRSMVLGRGRYAHVTDPPTLPAHQRARRSSRA